MQEIADIERLTQQLKTALTGQTLVRVSDVLPGALDQHLANVAGADLQPRLAGLTVQGIRRHGSHLMMTLRTGWNLYRWFVLEWQMSASGWLVPANAAARQAGGAALAQSAWKRNPARSADLFRLEFGDGQSWTYLDPQRWGRILLWSHAEVMQGRAGNFSLLGPDWLDQPEQSRQALRDFLPRSRRRLTSVLLDPRIAAGMDNVLACEVLHSVRLHPAEIWCNLTPERRAGLADGCVRETRRRCAQITPVEVFNRDSDWCLRPDCVESISFVRDKPRKTQRSFFCPGCQPLSGGLL